jgi:hypothetical protein
MSHHKTAEAIGATSGCMVTVKHALFSWGEGAADEILSDTEIAVRDRDPAETQRPLGPVPTRNEAE